MPNEYKQIKQSLPDKDGNYFKVYKDTQSIVIKLCLHNENREREIGVVNISARMLNMKRVRSQHLLIKSNSYGFNEHILSTATTFDKVFLSDDQESWIIPKEYIIENGRYLFFKEQGFERQVFLSLDKLEQFKTGKLF